ncbi:hypothetical protein NQP46_13540 [Streptomyces albus]|nr:hypothetical protein NQP46_13540 [Streptomyces albus]
MTDRRPIAAWFCVLLLALALGSGLVVTGMSPRPRVPGTCSPVRTGSPRPSSGGTRAS